MTNSNDFTKCNCCGSMIPRDREVRKKEDTPVNIGNIAETMSFIASYCPICNNWLYSEKSPVVKKYTKGDLINLLKQYGDMSKRYTNITNKPKLDISNMEEKMQDALKKKGTVIVIEGTDGSGKRTQSEMLLKRLTDMGIKASLYSFPNYNSDQGKIVKRYLNGEFKDQPCNKDHNAYYRNAIMYANDRLVTCMEKGADGRSILEKYNDGEVLIFDRYTQSNFIHQGCHIDDQFELEDFIAYMTELEYDILGLPKPDKVIYLKVAPEVSMKNIETRGNEKDMHENLEALKKANKHVDFLIDWLGWDRINCTRTLKNSDTGRTSTIMHSRESIHHEVFTLVEPILVENNQTRHVKYCSQCLESGLYQVVRPRVIRNNDNIKIGVCPTCNTLYDIDKI